MTKNYQDTEQSLAFGPQAGVALGVGGGTDPMWEADPPGGGPSERRVGEALGRMEKWEGSGLAPFQEESWRWAKKINGFLSG